MFRRIFLSIFFLLLLFSAKAEATHLKDIAKRFVSKSFQDYKVLYVSAPNVDIPGNKIKLKVVDKNRYYLKLKAEAGGKVYYINVRISKLKPVVVAVKDIFPKSLIRKSDINIERLPESKAANGFSSLEEVVGKRAKRLIKKGTVIKLYMIEPDYKVLKNTPVKVIYRKGVINIELIGLALQNGSVGDIIEVKNISTGKKILCKVLKSGVVEFVE